MFCYFFFTFSDLTTMGSCTGLYAQVWHCYGNSFVQAESRQGVLAAGWFL